MKLLVISRDMYTPEYRKLYAKAAELSGWEVTILVPETWPWPPETHTPRLAEKNIRVIRGGTYFTGVNYAHIYKNLGGIMRNEAPDIIELVEEPFSVLSMALLSSVKKLNKRPKLIFSSSQNIFRAYPVPFSFFEKNSLSGYDAAFAISGEVRVVLAKKGYDIPVYVIPWQVDTELFKKENAPPAGPDFTCGFWGRLDKIKGLETLIDAISLVPPGITLKLIGGGRKKEWLKSYAKERGLEHRVEFSNHAPHMELALHLRHIDAFLLSGTPGPKREQFCRSLIEAMSCGLPSILPDTGVQKDMAGEAALLYPLGDGGALARKIKELAEDKNLYAEMSRKARERAVALYSVEKVAEMKLKAFRETLSKLQTNLGSST